MKYAKVMAKTVLLAFARKVRAGLSAPKLKYPAHISDRTRSARTFFLSKKPLEVEISGGQPEYPA